MDRTVMTSWRLGLLSAAALISVTATGPAALSQTNPVQQDGKAPTAPVSDAATTTASQSAENSAGAKGAKTYCFMRGAGNTHKISWDAAYALIKRQSPSLFKTSPEHAAVMITEAVVADPGKFPDCGKYLGDLYVKAVVKAEESEKTAEPHPDAKRAAEANGASSSNRYAY